jgi:hypothetical protein
LDGIESPYNCCNCILHGSNREDAPVRLAETQLKVVATPTEAAPIKGVAVRRSWQKHLLSFLMVFGPDLTVMEDNGDAGAVSTYMRAGGSTDKP